MHVGVDKNDYITYIHMKQFIYLEQILYEQTIIFIIFKKFKWMKLYESKEECKLNKNKIKG
jgi:hypothetical protein